MYITPWLKPRYNTAPAISYLVAVQQLLLFARIYAELVRMEDGGGEVVEVEVFTKIGQEST